MQKPGSVDKDFIDLVARDVRGLLREPEKSKLHAEENLDRMYDALNALKKDVEVQLSNQKSRWVKKRHELNLEGDDGTYWIEYKASEADWRARAIKFLMAVEDQIAAAKSRRRDRNVIANNSKMDELIDEVYTHMEEIGDNEASEADQRVWAKARVLREGGG